MKWFFAYADDNFHHYTKLIKVAVVTAQKNTDLELHCVYDGQPSDITVWLEQQGVSVIYHRSYLDEDIVRVFGKGPSRGGRGAFLRVDIPKILVERGFDDEFVLYTDCDVMFMNNVDGLQRIKPEYFACAPEFDPNEWSYVNSGVMLMNLKNLYRTYEGFCSYIRRSMNKEWTWDQTAYNLYYCKKITKLPLEYNWKPYWGDSSDKKIIHFHGPKPMQLEQIKDGTAEQILCDLFNRNKDTYYELFDIWNEYYKETVWL